MSQEEAIEVAMEIADNIGSPWGEGATYRSIFPDYDVYPKLKIERPRNGSHLDDQEYEIFVNDLVRILT